MVHIRFIILMSSYYHLLSIIPGDIILNKIIQLYSSCNNSAKTCCEKYIFISTVFVQQNCQRSLKKTTMKETYCNDFCCICRCEPKSYCKNFKFQSFNLEFTLCISQGKSSNYGVELNRQSLTRMHSGSWQKVRQRKHFH